MDLQVAFVVTIGFAIQYGQNIQFQNIMETNPLEFYNSKSFFALMMHIYRSPHKFIKFLQNQSDMTAKLMADYILNDYLFLFAMYVGTKLANFDLFGLGERGLTKILAYGPHYKYGKWTICERVLRLEHYSGSHWQILRRGYFATLYKKSCILVDHSGEQINERIKSDLAYHDLNSLMKTARYNIYFNGFFYNFY